MPAQDEPCGDPGPNFELTSACDSELLDALVFLVADMNSSPEYQQCGLQIRDLFLDGKIGVVNFLGSGEPPGQAFTQPNDVDDEGCVIWSSEDTCNCVFLLKEYLDEYLDPAAGAAGALRLGSLLIHEKRHVFVDDFVQYPPGHPEHDPCLSACSELKADCDEVAYLEFMGVEANRPFVQLLGFDQVLFDDYLQQAEDEKQASEDRANGLGCDCGDGA